MSSDLTLQEVPFEYQQVINQLAQTQQHLDAYHRYAAAALQGILSSNSFSLGSILIEDEDSVDRQKATIDYLAKRCHDISMSLLSFTPK